LLAPRPGNRHYRRQQHQRRQRRSADDEDMGRDRANHRRREQGSALYGAGVGANSDSAPRHFHCAGEIAEPLGGADRVEHRDHGRRASEFRAARHQESSGASLIALLCA
jgi:hypothetical protein